MPGFACASDYSGTRMRAPLPPARQIKGEMTGEGSARDALPPLSLSLGSSPRVPLFFTERSLFVRARDLLFFALYGGDDPSEAPFSPGASLVSRRIRLECLLCPVVGALTIISSLRIAAIVPPFLLRAVVKLLSARTPSGKDFDGISPARNALPGYRCWVSRQSARIKTPGARDKSSGAQTRKPKNYRPFVNYLAPIFHAPLISR